MDDKKIVITKNLAFPIEIVWDAWTREEKLKEWMAPEGWTIPDATIDLQVGGMIDIVMAGKPIKQIGSSGKVSFTGIYKIIEKPKKLVFTWHWKGQKNETLVTIFFKLLSSTQTELQLIHEGFLDDTSVKEDTFAWKSTLKHLKQFLEKSL